jgi:hypothetical protein
MQIMPNTTSIVLDNINSQSNKSINSANNQQLTNSNSEPSQPQPLMQPDKYKQYTSFESNYFKSLINTLLPNNNSQSSSNVTPSNKQINQPNNPPPSITLTPTNTETKITDKLENSTITTDTTRVTKDTLYTEWKDGKNNTTLIPRQNDFNDIIRKTTEDPKNPFPELSAKELKSLIAKESTFNPSALSPTGRKGLAQLDENTAKTQGALKFDGLADPRLNPDKAIAAIPKVLSKKFKYLESNENQPGLKYYNQDKPLPKEEKLKFALAAYNAGEGQVKKALNKAYKSNIPPDGIKFEDVRPFLPKQENRDYVPLILDKINEK